MSEETEPKEKQTKSIKTTSKVAPKITFDQVFGDERMRIQKEWDDLEPNMEHMWCNEKKFPDLQRRLKAEVVMFEGKEVEHGADFLLRIPADIWKQRQDIEQHRSHQLAAKARGVATRDGESYSTGNLKQFRRPVQVEKS